VESVPTLDTAPRPGLGELTVRSVAEVVMPVVGRPTFCATEVP
jgi:hypothetical protein